MGAVMRQDRDAIVVHSVQSGLRKRTVPKIVVAYQVESIHT